MQLRYPLSSNLITHVDFALNGAEYVIEKSCGLGIAQFLSLSYLSSHHENFTQKDLAKHLGFSTKTISVAAVSLEDRGYISREFDSKDQRKKWLGITPAGRCALSHAESEVSAFVSSLWKPLATDYARSILKGLKQADKVLNSNAPRSGEVKAVSTYVADVHNVIASIAAEVKEAGLTLNDFRVLFSLYEYPCGLRPGQVANHLLLYPYEVTEAVNRLAVSGYVNQENDPFDGRAFSLRISKDGLNKIYEIAPIVDDWFCDGNWTTTPKERESYAESADFIVGRLRRIYAAIHAKGSTNVGTQHICTELMKM